MDTRVLCNWPEVRFCGLAVYNLDVNVQWIGTEFCAVQ